MRGSGRIVAVGLLLVVLGACSSNLEPRSQIDEPGFKETAEGYEFADDARGAPAQPAATLPSNGLVGEYFDNKDFTGPVVRRVDPEINFTWNSLAPLPSMGADTFSVRWTGEVEPRYSEQYTFYTVSDDGVRLWVNGQLLINNWANHGAKEDAGTITLQAGKRYTIKMEFYDNTGKAVVKLRWSSARQAKEVIPSSQLFPTGPLIPLPADPSGLTATATSGQRVDLRWGASANASQYELERKAGDGSFAPLARLSGTSYADVSVSGNTTYTYRVRATNEIGESSWVVSNTVTTPPTGSSRAHLEGKFGPVQPWPLVAAHAALLPDGKVISWYSYDAVGDYRDIKDPQAYFHNSTLVGLWDPATNTHERVDNPTTDLFCAGWVLLSDGRFFVAGGNEGSPNGSPDTNVFYSQTKAWSPGPVMSGGRWYPTTTLLPNKEALIIGGTDQSGADNGLAEVYQTNGTLRALTGARTETWDFTHWYPWMHVAPNGLVFYSGASPRMGYLNPAGTGSWTLQFSRGDPTRTYGTSVMYQPGKILVAGGGGTNATTKLIDLLTLNAYGEPTVTVGPPMAYGRTHLNATLLADGRVFVNGGNDGTNFDDSSSVYRSEIWNPKANAWTLGATAQVPRNYHSTALLLPDGTVWTAGGGGCGSDCTVNRFNYEIYYPPYLFKKDGSGNYAPRPSLASVPTALAYGQGFSLGTPQAASIQKVTLVALGAATHAFNMNQRFLELPITARGASTLQATAPASPNLAPPGFYLLFILDADGVPSVAKVVNLQ
ncbi:PA14 domain-containing protein [Calidithermus chliarophilus]|uniref:PA14 domain-containing protein n=1 Tax=Calidithermus chliarophilus TaxID=52023 RepID=UPI0009FCB980|nr:PA14 domain-containing protein [Calidithermus chliarophilus]